MSRLAIVLRIGLAAGGLVFATSCLALAGNAKAGSIETIAPVSSTSLDIVADGTNGNATATAEVFKTVSPSIIASIVPAAESSQKTEENEKKRFDPAPLVIRAGMIGDAAPVEISATRDEQSEPDGHLLPPQSGDKPAQAEDQKEPTAAPE